MRVKVGDLIQYKDSLDTCYLVTKKSNWAYHVQCLDEVYHRSIRFNETKRVKAASDFVIKKYISKWLRSCVCYNYTKGI